MDDWTSTRFTPYAAAVVLNTACSRTVGIAEYGLRERSISPIIQLHQCDNAKLSTGIEGCFGSMTEVASWVVLVSDSVCALFNET
jgi:hypothetical protein